MKKIKVYVVIAGYTYDGYSAEGLRVFSNKKEANEYAVKLGEKFGDFIHVIERLVKID